MHVFSVLNIFLADIVLCVIDIVYVLYTTDIDCIYISVDVIMLDSLIRKLIVNNTSFSRSVL